MDLGESYPDALFEALSNISGLIHYDSSVPKLVIKMCKSSLITSALITSAAVVFFKGLYCGIPWALSCSNYSNCVKMRWRPHFDHCSRWILIISRRIL